MNMQRLAVDGVVGRYWAAFFGLPTLPAAGTSIVPHAGLGDYAGVGMTTC